VEQEFYVSGTADRYAMPGPLAEARVVDGGYHYKTRMLVRRPADSRKFNGTVVLEWYSVTTGQDIDFNYGAAHEYLLRKGYAIVAVSAQRWCCDAQEVESRPLRRPHARSAAA
jgi:hypothetical protein